MEEPEVILKFKVGDKVTKGILPKTILHIMYDKKHYLTDTGIISFDEQDEWKLYIK